MRFRSWRSGGPPVVAGLALHDQRVLVEDVHNQAEWLSATRTNQFGFMNGCHVIRSPSKALRSPALGRGPDVAALRTAPRAMRGGVPSKGADEDGLFATALQAALLDWLLGLVWVGMRRPIRHGNGWSISVLRFMFCTETQYRSFCRTKVLWTKVAALAPSTL